MTTQDRILEVPILHLLAEADRRAREMPDMFETVKQGNRLGAKQTGCLGEVIGEEYLKNLGTSYTPVFSTEFDVMVHLPEGDKKTEFKTKERTVRPLPEYECSVYDYVKDFQNVDYYMFISLFSTDSDSSDINRFTRGFIVGSITKQDFDKKAKFWKKGDIDPTNGWSVRRDTWSVFILDLTAPPFLEKARNYEY